MRGHCGGKKTPDRDRSQSARQPDRGRGSPLVFHRSRRLEGEKFVRQLQIDYFVADFACRTARLAIELDGGQHDAARDAARTAIIETYGYRVLRVWNDDVLANMEGVLEAIRQELLTARDRTE